MLMRCSRTALGAVFALLSTSVCTFAAAKAADASADWPCWRGVDRDGKSPDKGLLQEWPAGGPKQLWQARGLGEGFANVAVTGGRIYTAGAVNGQLIIFALDMDGKEVWRKEHGPAWTKNYAGSRATPTIDEGKLYLVSGEGKIGCYDIKDGKELWTRTMAELGGRPHNWGFAESVLIDQKLAIVTPGGKNGVVALDKATGKTVWQSPGNGAPAHYGSCLLATHDKVPMVIATNGGGIFAVSPKDGKVLWRNDFSAGNTANCPTPVYADGYVFWATGYGKGGICLKLEKDGAGLRATEAWRTGDMVCHHGGFIVHEGYLYGNHNGGWTCLELKSGAKKWEGRGVGKGAVCFADGMLYLFGEKGGEAGLAKATPAGLEMKGTFRVQGKGPSWAHPVVIGGRLYLRYADNLYCFDVKR